MLRRHGGGARREAADAASPGTAVGGNSDLKDQFSQNYQCLDVPIKPSLGRAPSALGGGVDALTGWSREMTCGTR
jgi:hypothetical protein